MGMVATLFSGADPFEQIVNILSTEGSMWNLVKTAQVVSEKTLKNHTILYMYVAQGQGQTIPGDKILIEIKKCYYFYHTSYVLAVSL